MVIDPVSRPRSIPALVLGLVLVFALALPAKAMTLLRDADIEHGLTQLAGPVLRAAGLSPQRVRIYVVDQSSLNAFVLDNRSIFVTRGLIQKVDRADMLQAILAHEAAHIANGHIARRSDNFRSAKTAGGFGLALAIIAAAAGAGEAASGIVAGTQSSALRNFLKHTRAEEASADRSAAGFMRQAGIDPQGLVDLHRLFHGQELLSVGRQDPYMRSHPLTRDRIRAAEAYVAAYGGSTDPNPNTAYWFARLRGKLTAFTTAPKWTFRRITSESYKDVAYMREAVAHHRGHDLEKALHAIDRAIALRPKDGFYQELKGQILMENRQTKSAIAAYRKAATLAPKQPLILGGLGRSLLADGQPRAALKELERARARDFRDARLLRDMSVAYAKTGQTGMAALVTGERYALQGRMEDAHRQARRAVGLLPNGSPAWQRAQDVLIASEKYLKRK